MGAAGLLLLTARVQPRTGPALRQPPLPVTATVLSAVVHGALAVALVVGAHVFAPNPSKTYIVNLVPAVAAVGVRRGSVVPQAVLALSVTASVAREHRRRHTHRFGPPPWPPSECEP